MAQKLTIQGKEFEFEHRDSSLDKRGTLKIKQTMRERFGGEFPFGSFAGSVAKASEVLDFIDSEIELAITEERKNTASQVKSILDELERENAHLDIRTTKEYIINLIIKQ